MSTPWESGRLGGRPLGEKTTISDTGNAVSPEDTRIPRLCGGPSLVIPASPDRQGKPPANTGLGWFSWKGFHTPPSPSYLPACHPSTPVDFWHMLPCGPLREGGVCLWPPHHGVAHWRGWRLRAWKGPPATGMCASGTPEGLAGAAGASGVKERTQPWGLPPFPES